MTSAINPNNINGAYPVAGQDNNSQGFRDNFTNTKTNFQYAKDEISDLQSKAVLKAALVGTTLNNNMGGSVLSNAQLQDMGQTVVPLGTLTGTVNIDYSLGPVQTVTTNGPISLNFLNLQASGVNSTWTVTVTVSNVAHTLQLPTAVSVNTVGIQGYNSGTGIITFAATGTYSFTFSTNNGGTTVSVIEVNKRIQPFNASSEDLAASAAANLALTTSYFTTAAVETATLAAGVDGQIKVFAMVESAGNMSITVTNAGWKVSGTGLIVFSARGQACTLQYTNNKWFCIGNNGAAFS
jgi:hypothetical protein